MDTDRIKTCAGRIAKNRLALKWLRDHGAKLVEREGRADITVRLLCADDYPGAREAAELLGSYARQSLSEFVSSSIASCVNTIAMDREAIREELDRDEVSA